MVVISEFTLDHPILRSTLRTVPDIEVEWQKSHTKSDGSMRMLAWVDADDYDAVEDAVRADPTVMDPTVLTETDERRLYRLTYVEDHRETSLHSQLVESGSVLLEAIGTNDGWWYRGRFPDREALQGMYRFCRDHGIEFTFHGIYGQTDFVGGGRPTLTDAQLETLSAAVESGYLSIPRECTLDELGERMGVSRNAASERFRRAVRNLILQTVDVEREE